MVAALKRIPTNPVIDIDGRTYPVIVRLNPRARRLIVRLDQKGRIVVVSPSKHRVSQALAFAEEQKAWLAKQLRAMPAPIPFEDHAIVPFRNIPHRLTHRPTARGGVWREEHDIATADLPCIIVTGRPEFFERRVTDWFRKTAKADLATRCAAYAQQLNLRPTKITVRDSTSRWGSCSHTGTLSFSWRLIFAPAFVLDYVAAHETAHRIHMHHGQPFWSLVDQLTAHRDAAETWLSDKGNDLHLIGARSHAL